MDAAFREAVRAGHLDSVREGLDRGLPLDAYDRYGQTGLMLAAHAGHEDVVAELIGRGADLDVTAKYGLSALMLAVVAGHAGVARALVRAGADRSITGTGAPGFAGRTAGDLARARGMAPDVVPD